MGVGEVHHIVLDVADLERSEEFYGAGLGLDPVGRNLWPGSEATSSFRLEEGAYLVLEQVAQPRPDPPGVHIRFAVAPEAWDGIVERLRRQGHALRDERKAGLRAVGEAGLNVTDPDGHVLELELHGPAAFEIPAAGRGRVVAGRIEDFPIGSVTRIPEGQCFLVRLADGFLALSQACTHMQFAVAYQPEHYRFYCARHRRRFSRTGQYLPRFGVDDTPPLRTYAIEYVDGQVVIDTDVSLPRTRAAGDCPVPLPPQAGAPAGLSPRAGEG